MLSKACQFALLFCLAACGGTAPAPADGSSTDVEAEAEQTAQEVQPGDEATMAVGVCASGVPARALETTDGVTTVVVPYPRFSVHDYDLTEYQGEFRMPEAEAAAAVDAGDVMIMRMGEDALWHPVHHTECPPTPCRGVLCSAVEE